MFTDCNFCRTTGFICSSTECDEKPAMECRCLKPRIVPCPECLEQQRAMTWSRIQHFWRRWFELVYASNVETNTTRKVRIRRLAFKAWTLRGKAETKMNELVGATR